MRITIRAAAGTVCVAAILAVAALKPAVAGTYTFITDFTKTNNIQTGLIKEFPTGVFTAANSFGTQFDIVADGNSHNFSEISGAPLVISTSLSGVSNVYTLMNAYYPANGASLATVEFIGDGGADQTFTLVNGVNIRDFYHGVFANTINGTTSQNAFTVNNVQDAGGTGNVNTGLFGTYLVDEQNFALDPAFLTQTLKTIKITSLGNGEPILLGVTAYASGAVGAGSVKQNTPDGQAVNTSPMIVTATFGDSFYIEQPDRACGIRVDLPGNSAAVGQQVEVLGTASTDSSTGERYIQALSAASLGSTAGLNPLEMVNKALGGDGFGLQEGVEGGTGLNNIGLLVTTTGRVSSPAGGVFYVDDGSGAVTKVTASGALPADSSYVAVTGISSCEKGSGGLTRLLKALTVTTLAP